MANTSLSTAFDHLSAVKVNIASLSRTRIEILTPNLSNTMSGSSIVLSSISRIQERAEISIDEHRAADRVKPRQR